MERRTSKSTKSSSGLKGHRRYVEFRESSPEDMKYLWAAYKKGALDSLDPVFQDDMDTREFMEVVGVFLGQSRLTTWTMVAETNRGVIPVGLVLGWVSGRVVSVWRMIPFPWSSPRNIVESVSNAFDTVRKQVFDEGVEINDPQRYFVVLAFTEFADKKFYERISDMGILRKVGHVLDMQPSGTSILFQTRSPVR